MAIRHGIGHDAGSMEHDQHQASLLSTEQEGSIAKHSGFSVRKLRKLSVHPSIM